MRGIVSSAVLFLTMIAAAGAQPVLPVVRGGTGTSSTPSNGQILTGNGTAYVPRTMTGDCGFNTLGVITCTGLDGHALPSLTAGALTWNGSSWAFVPAGGTGTVTSITAGSGLTGGTITTSGTIGCDTASGIVFGCLSAADWTTFNNKGNGTITTCGNASPLFNCAPSGSSLNFSLLTAASHLFFGNCTGSTATPTYCQVDFAYLAGALSFAQRPAGGSSTTYFRGDGVWATPSGAGTVTSVGTTFPLTGGPITTTGNVACPTCARGPGTSVGDHMAGFLNTDGLTLKDLGAIPTGSPGGSTFRASQHCTVLGTYDETCVNNASRAATAVGGGTVILDVPDGATGPQTYNFTHDAFTNACAITAWTTTGTTGTVSYANTTGACTVAVGKLILISGTVVGGGGHNINNGGGNPTSWTVATASGSGFTFASTIAADSGGAGGVVDTKQPVVWQWQTSVTVNIAHNDGAGHFGVCYGEKSWLFGQTPGFAAANTSYPGSDFKTTNADVDAIVRPCNQNGMQQGGGYKGFNVLLDGANSRFRLGAAFPTTEAFTGSEMGNMLVQGGAGAPNFGTIPNSYYSFSSGTPGTNTTAVVVVDALNANVHAGIPATTIIGGSSSGPTDILIKSFDQEHTRATTWTGVAATFASSQITFTVTAPNYAYRGVQLMATGCADTNYNLTWNGNLPSGATGGVSSFTATTIVVPAPAGFAGGASTSGCTVEIAPPIVLIDGGGGATNSVSTAAGINIGRGYMEAENGSFFSRYGFLVRNGAHDNNFNNFRFAGGNHFAYGDVVVEGPVAPVNDQWHNLFCHLSDTWLYKDTTKSPIQQIPCSPYPHASEVYDSDGNYFQSLMMFGRNTAPTSSLSAATAMQWSKASDPNISYRPHLLLNNDGKDYQYSLENAANSHTVGNLVSYGTGGIQQDSSVATVSGGVKPVGTTVGALPSAAANPFLIIGVTDSTTVATEGQVCVGGSGNKAIAISNGTVWKCF